MKATKEKEPTMVSVAFLQLCLLFTVTLIASNVFETKQISIGCLNITGGLLIFPICYIICDCICEVWGFNRSKTMLILGFIMNFLFIVAGAICDVLPAADYWNNQEGFHAIFGLSPRITLASFVAFLIGGFVNIQVLLKMKERSGGKRLGLRLIVSSIAGHAADSLLFFPIAFLGVLSGKEIMGQMLMQFIIKTVYEIVFLPVMFRIIKRLEACE